MSATVPALPKIGHSIQVLDEVDSTNNYAMQAIKQGLAPHGTVYFAQKQTQGKGQHGKTWHTEPGSNIIMSAVLQTEQLPPQQPFLLSMAVAVACAEFLTLYTQSDVCIKWPNDIYWNDRKAGGILIENLITAHYQASTQWSHSVVGIGINVNQTVFDAALANPVSMRQITGKKHVPILLCKQLCGHLQTHFEALCRGEHTLIIEAYNNLLYKKNQQVTLQKGAIKF
ncbi:MAG: biotin--[acetyl-CoA-carboxylase] ligase, partial [Bacteroidetes bacterium]